MVVLTKGLITIIGIIIELFLPSVLFKKLGKKTSSNLLSLAVIVIVLLVQTLNNFIFLSKSPYVMLITTFTIFVLSLRFKMEIKARIYSSVFIFIIGVLSEFTIAYSATMFFNVDTKFTQTNPYLLFICTISSKFLQYTILKIIKLNGKSEHSKFSFSVTYNILPLPLASLPILLLLFDCCYKMPEKRIQIISLISSVLLILANIFVFNLIEKHSDYINTKNQLNFTKKHIDYQVQHYEELYRHQYEIRKYRHDTKNRLTGLLAMIENEKYEQAVLTIKKELDLINDTSNNIVNSNNPILDAVILSKIKTASIFKINIETSIVINEPIHIDSIELGVLIGNALDNAIEATKETLHLTSSPTIYIKLLSLVEHISIEITNPVKEQINTKILKTNKQNPYFHGFGIQSMRSIAAKYNGEVFFDCEDCRFVVDIILANT